MADKIFPPIMVSELRGILGFRDRRLESAMESNDLPAVRELIQDRVNRARRNVEEAQDPKNRACFHRYHHKMRRYQKYIEDHIKKHAMSTAAA